MEFGRLPTCIFMYMCLFLFSRHHIPTNSEAPFFKATHNPQFLQSLWRRANARNVSLFYPLQWLIYVFNPVVNTKLPAILSHRRSTTVSLETYPLYSMRNSVQMGETSIFEVLHSGSCFFFCNFNRTSKSRFKKRECAYKELFLPALPSQEYCLYHSQPGNLTEAQSPVTYSNNLQFVQLQISRNWKW